MRPLIIYSVFKRSLKIKMWSNGSLPVWQTRTTKILPVLRATLVKKYERPLAPRISKLLTSMLWTQLLTSLRRCVSLTTRQISWNGKPMRTLDWCTCWTDTGRWCTSQEVAVLAMSTSPSRTWRLSLTLQSCNCPFVTRYALLLRDFSKFSKRSLSLLRQFVHRKSNRTNSAHCSPLCQATLSPSCLAQGTTTWHSEQLVQHTVIARTLPNLSTRHVTSSVTSGSAIACLKNLTHQPTKNLKPKVSSRRRQRSWGCGSTRSQLSFP